MTHERSDRIQLDASEARCEPQTACAMKTRCARYQAVIAQGSPLTDFSTGTLGGTAMCFGYVDLTRSAPKPPMQRPVRPPVRGIG